MSKDNNNNLHSDFVKHLHHARLSITHDNLELLMINFMANPNELDRLRIAFLKGFVHALHSVSELGTAELHEFKISMIGRLENGIKEIADLMPKSK